MNTRLSDAILEDILSDYSVKCVISDGKIFSVPTKTKDEVTVESHKDYERVPFGKEVIFMSSGTTNNVKLCAYTSENFFYQILDSGKIIRQCPKIKEHYEGELKHLVLLPFCHVFGFIAVYLWFGFFSRTFVFPKDLNPDTIQRTVKKHKVTHIFAVPMVWDAVYKAAIAKIKDKGETTYKRFSKVSAYVNRHGKLGDTVARRLLGEVRDGLFGDSITCMITGGGHIKAETISFFNGIGYHPTNGYGMTEIGIASVELSESTKYLNSGSAGKPFGSISFRVNENGLLEVQSKSIANEIKVKDKIYTYTEKDFFPTGDGAKIKNKRLYILGRGDDLIVSSSGENVSPSAIEDGISIPDVSVCMLGVDKGGKIVSTLLVQINKYFSKKKIASIKSQLFEIIKERGYGSLIEEIYFTNEPLMLESEFKLNRNSIRKRIASGDIQLIHLDKKISFL